MLRKLSSPRKRLLKRARLNPLVLLLDAALTGELEVVKEAVEEVSLQHTQPGNILSLVPLAAGGKGLLCLTPPAGIFLQP